MENLHRDLSKHREREEKSRDLSNRSLKTDRDTERERRTYIGKDIRKTSL